jgi:Domain of unknown function (DUF4865)
MLAMQYRVTLPTDYDMDVIRTRVATTGALLDAYPGLGVKAFLIREKGVDGATANEYAPFYLWADAAGAASFLWSGVGFPAIVRDFGRPAVQTWVGGTSRRGPAGLDTARSAVRTTTRLDVDTDVVAAAAAADDRCAAAVRAPGTVLAAYGIDPHGWELVEFSLHADRPDADPARSAVFQVLHLSAPEPERLPDRVDTRMAVPPTAPAATSPPRPA